MDTTAADAHAPSTTTTVQRVTKKSSDELLRKFAELGEDEPKKRLKKSKTRKEYSLSASCESPSHYSSTTLVERRSLLPQLTRKSVLLRQLGIGRSQFRARDIKNKSILVAIEKTWRKTLEGASKVLLEKKHYNRHRRLISDVV
ncbi:hypothetical protein GH714_031627 [Hevea brasiliensis]|uniref:Uncharacterized protein n=1 Tax=Hevea brasiliensis TaxID=3981 RepID=A0A6A6M684_HEVBR|nr:hypothetical protein GH714_031627 [Hevea brasiliensis]